MSRSLKTLLTSIIDKIKTVSDAQKNDTRIELIWTNPSPTSNFNAGTLSFTDDYKSGWFTTHYIVEVMASTSNAKYNTHVIPYYPNSDGRPYYMDMLIDINAASAVYCRTRAVAPYADSLVFNSAYNKAITATTTTANNSFVIPTQVWRVMRKSM